MKKIIVALLLCASFQAKSQTVNLYTDSTNNQQYCNVVPEMYSLANPDSARALYITHLDDGNSVVVYYNLVGNSGLLHRSNVTLTGSDYAAWAQSDSYLYNYVANKLHLTIAP